MSKPFFSVIIPSFNRAYIIDQTINSVLCQKFTDFEIILVDDGSIDNTKEVVSNINDDRVKYLYQKNAERSAARNNGIRHAKGKYICFLDSDDWFEDNHLEILFHEINNRGNEPALFFTHFYIFQNGIKTKPEIETIKTSAFLYLLTYPVIPARVCVHHKILKQFNFREDIVIVEDQVLWVTIAYKFPVYQIPEYTIVYHLHEDNSINIKKNCFRPRLDGMRKLFKQPEVGKAISKDEKREIISNCYYGIAKHFAFKKRYFQMFLNVMLSILYSPFHEHTKAKLYMLINPKKSF